MPDPEAASREVYKAHISCTMNQGDIVVEFGPTDKIRDLGEVIKKEWDIQLGKSDWSVFLEGPSGFEEVRFDDYILPVDWNSRDLAVVELLIVMNISGA